MISFSTYSRIAGRAKAIIMTAVFMPAGGVLAQAYFNGHVSEAVSGSTLRNARIMVVNGRDTTFFPVKEDGTYDIVTREGRNRIFAVAPGFVTELNSIEAAKGSVNKVDISMVKKAAADLDTEKRARYEATLPSPSEMSGTGSSGLISTGGGVKYLPHLMPGKMVATPGAAGRLTAGSILDFGKWKMWNDIHQGILSGHMNKWRMATAQRYVLQVSTPAGVPVVDAPVELVSGSKVLWKARTDNTGKVELWGQPFRVAEELNKEGAVYARVTAFGKTQRVDGLRQFENGGVNFCTADGPCAMSDQLDIAFVVDATGSMGDEINYLKRDLDTFIKATVERNRDINLRLASIFYRDNGDEYLFRLSPFSSNSTITDNFILDQSANGGGDFPEALDVALSQAVRRLAWSSTARARIIFLMLDAPAHMDQPTIDSIHFYTRKAAEMGIRIVPVACSGIDKSTEVLMRSIAILTNGTYLFLTNHGGIGNPHLEPTTDVYAIRSLLEEMLAVSTAFSVVPDCSKLIDPRQVVRTDSLRIAENPYGPIDSVQPIVLTPKDSAALRDSALIRERGRHRVIEWVKFWPNPTDGLVNVRIEADIREIFIADVGGKLLQRRECHKGDLLQLDLSQYSAGIYYIKYPTGNGWMAERIVLRR